MFSVSNLNHSVHNQQAILFHLTNLTPRITKVCTKREKSSAGGKLKKDNQQLRQDMVEIFKNEFKSSIVDKSKKFKFSLKFNNCSPLDKILITTSSVWKVDTSFVSANSFNLNKNSVVCNDRQSSSQHYLNDGLGGGLRKINRLEINFLNTQKQQQQQQRRTFKTHRSVIAENKRNPSMASRWKDAFNQQSSHNELDMDGRSKFESHTMSTGANAKNVQHESLSKLLNQIETNLTPEQKQQLKVSFAEGYLAASHAEKTQKEGRTLKYLRVLHLFLWICVGMAIIFSVFSTSNGSVFRIQLGANTEVDPEDISVTFEDVKGCDEAKQELKEVVEFLKNPEKFSTLGGKLPKGVLLIGPPGTGKTLLARAVAGEASVPFFHAAGPEFDEVLVGQGARRVRDLFKAAKDRAPCVIFIDEIDSVGSKRTNSALHPYANQTINQLLTEMDGFQQNEGVIVLGATNRVGDLDPALLRPGRFDVEVAVPTPDYCGRKDILTHYLSKVLSRDIDVDILARRTTGFTGADLENMINQAALRAAIEGAEVVGMRHIEYARDKVIMGPERKTRIPDEEVNKMTAYHEGGHALVAYYTKESMPLHKVTIMPRGESLGHTAYIPEKERYQETKAQLLATMDTALGGRAAEELIFGIDKITTGASSDLQQATMIASKMVKDWGMSEKVGLRTIKSEKGAPLSSSTIESVDSEIKKMLADSYERAKAILKIHAKEHKALAEALLKYETLDAEDVKAILSGGKIPDASTR